MTAIAVQDTAGTYIQDAGTIGTAAAYAGACLDMSALDYSLNNLVTQSLAHVVPATK